MALAATSPLLESTSSGVEPQPFSRLTEHVIAAANDSLLPFSTSRLASDAQSPAELADLCGCEASQVLHTVLYRGKISVKPSLLLIPGDTKIDERKISALIGDVLVRAEESLVLRLTGFSPNTLPPLGMAARIPVVMDKQLLRHTHLWCFAGDSRVAISFPSEKLALALSARIASIT